MNEEKKRLFKIVKSIVPVLVLGFLYYIFVRVTGYRIPCVFYELTGKYCPGCGVTRMCMALIELDFKTAMRNNLLVFFLLGIGSVYGVVKCVKYIKTGKNHQSLFEKICVIVIFVLMIIFTILRNTSYGVFLQPL